MSNPTSNFGWQMPTNSDLVTDLPADFEVFGQGVDTTLADLKGGTSGQILSKNTNADMDFVWINNDQGDITGVTATSPLTGGGTSGAITVGIQSASTTQSGAVQLTDSTSSTSTTTAATPNSVKSAYDLANAAVPNTRTISTTSPLSGGGALSGNLTLSVGAGSTSTAGVLQLTDSTSSTSTTTAATPNSVKSAYDPAFTNNFYAGKNKIINGAFNVWQRGTSISGGGFIADRWNNLVDGSGGAFTFSQQAFTPGTAPVSGYEATYFQRYNCTSARTGQTYCLTQQAVEDVRTFAGQTVTFSFWAKADSIRNVGLTLAQAFGSGGSASVVAYNTNQNFTTSWTRYSYTFTMPALTGKTIGTNSYVEIRFFYPVNTTCSIDIWGVQWEAGSVATPFQTATGTIQGELAACQRYYQIWTSPSASNAGLCTGAAVQSTEIKGVYYLIGNMRTTPTVSISAYSDFTTSFGRAAVTSMSASTYNDRVIVFNFGTNTASVLDKAFHMESQNTNAKIQFSAEL